MKKIDDQRIADIISDKWDVPEESRLAENHEELLAIVTELRKLGLTIVLTVGVYDSYHIGHARYLKQAKKLGDIVIVGIDTDEFTRARKGIHRPMVPYTERWEMLVHGRYANIVTSLNSSEENISLLKAMKPDVILLSFSSVKDNFDDYAERMHKKYDPLCGRLEILQRQAETSSSAMRTKIVEDGGRSLVETVEDITAKLKNAVEDFFVQARGGTE